MPPALVVLLAFLAMEPVSYLAHRFVMHGRRRAARWHVSHHQVRHEPGWEANDRYPVVLAALTIAGIGVGTAVPGWASLAWVGAGITLYGAAYLVVHDLYIHRRIARFTWTWGPLERVREAHRIHHLWGAEPYGFLFPIVPAELRERARHVERDPLARPLDGDGSPGPGEVPAVTP